MRRRDLASRDTPQSRHLIIRGGQSSVFTFNYIYMQPTLGREQKTLQIGPIPPLINSTDSYQPDAYLNLPARRLIINGN